MQQLASDYLSRTCLYSISENHAAHLSDFNKDKHFQTEELFQKLIISDKNQTSNRPVIKEIKRSIVRSNT